MNDVIYFLVTFIFLTVSFGSLGIIYFEPLLGLCGIALTGLFLGIRWLMQRSFENKIIEIALNKKTKKFQLDLPCQHCKEYDTVLFDFSVNEFKCSKCGQLNSIYTNVQTAQKSQ